MFTRVKTPSEIESMRTSGKILATVLDLMRKNTGAGATPNELAALAAKELKSLGGKPAFLNYHGFPSVICISVNEEVVHGIPNDRQLQEGDIVSYDFGVNYQGMITDSAITVPVGQLSPEVERLVKVTKESLYAGLSQLKNGVKVGDIGAAVQKVLADNKLGNVRDLVGHGVGHELHEDPNIPNYGMKNTGPALAAGMTIAVEPMATLGTDDIVIDEDGWTVVTADNSISAHFEHTVLITENGHQIITTI